MFDRVPHRLVRFDKIRAIHLQPQEARKARQQVRNIAAGGLLFHRHGNRVAVIFNQHQQGRALQAGDIHAFPELALAGGAFAGGDQGDSRDAGAR